jgi:hypothetical protein
VLVVVKLASLSKLGLCFISLLKGRGLLILEFIEAFEILCFYPLMPLSGGSLDSDFLDAAMNYSLPLELSSIVFRPAPPTKVFENGFFAV